MATSLSDKTRTIVEQQREAAAERVEQLSEESRALRALADEVDEELRKSSKVLQEAEELLGIAPQVPIESLNGELRGRRLREVAVELLRLRKGDRAVIHYTEWFELLRASGVRVGGKDPMATFLAQISGAPEVESVRPRSGLYCLKVLD